MMTRRLARLATLVAAILVISSGPLPGAVRPVDAVTPAPVQIYGAWHCSDDYCTWGKVRTITEFDQKNHWLVNHGDGTPSVNLVVLSFVNPLKLLNETDDATTVDGVPRGMTPEIVSYFTSRGIRVMLSIGGITYTTDWNTALKQNATLLGQRAAAVATRLGVGIEIDYEENRSPNLTGLQAFIDAYRLDHPHGGADPAATLTIDLAAGDRWLIGITRKATAEWLRVDAPVLDFANAMVPSKQPSASGAAANWQEHVDGKPQYAPPIPPLSPAMFTGSVYVAEGSRVRPECNNFASSLQKSTASFVRSVASRVPGDTSVGMLGWMFWAAEKPSVRGVGTQPPNTCEDGVGVGAATYDIPFQAP
jgi:hypothetical protein